MLNTKEIITHTKDLNILFVEDHKDLRVNTAHILNKFFNTVEVASDGLEAFEIFKKNRNKFDIIMSDIQMPHMNGIELTKKIYSLYPEQIIIILSAYDDSKYLHELINLKIEHFLKKPIDFQELLKALSNASKVVNDRKAKLTVSEDTNIILRGKFGFDKGKNLLYNNEEIIPLTKYEMIFMQLITSETGKIFSNEDITKYYSSKDENLDASNIRKLVSKLRRKLPNNSIESLYGVGYRLVPYLSS